MAGSENTSWPTRHQPCHVGACLQLTGDVSALQNTETSQDFLCGLVSMAPSHHSMLVSSHLRRGCGSHTDLVIDSLGTMCEQPRLEVYG